MALKEILTQVGGFIIIIFAIKYPQYMGVGWKPYKKNSPTTFFIRVISILMLLVLIVYDAVMIMRNF